MPDGQIVAFPDDMPREQINSMIFSRYPELQPEVPNAVKWAVNRMQKEGRTEPSLWENIVVGLSGGGQGAETALKKGTAGASFGASDWALRKAGLDDSQTDVNKIIDNPGDVNPGLVGMASNFADAGGSMATGAGVYKAGMKALGTIPKAGKYIAPVVTDFTFGSTRGGFDSDFNPKDMWKSGMYSALFGAGLRGGLGALDLAFSSASAIKGAKPGMKNAVLSDKANDTLQGATKLNRDVAKRVKQEVPKAQSELNQEMIDSLNKTGRNIDINKAVENSKQNLGNFINENADMPLVGKNISEYKTKLVSDFQKEAFDKSISGGLKMSGHKPGTLGSIHRAKEVLNDSINSSYDTTSGFPKPTTATRELMGVKNVLNEILDQSGIRRLDLSKGKAMRMQEAFNKGYNFKPSELKIAKQGLNTLRDRQAFLQGRIAKITDNVKPGDNIADAVRNDQNTLKYLMPERNFNKLMADAERIDTQYKRVSTLGRMAERKMGIKPAENRPYSEKIESKGAILGSIADFAKKYGTVNKYSRAANKILDPNYKQQTPLSEIIKPFIPGLSSYLTTKLNKKGDK